MFRDMEDRIDSIVEGLLRGRRVRAGSAEVSEREAIMTAAELASAREGYPRMSSGFRRRLTDTLKSGDDPGRISRRTALGAAAGLAAGAVGAAAFGRLPAPAKAPAAPRAGVAGGVMEPAGGRWIEVAAMSRLSELAPTRVVAGELIAFLFKQGDTVTAVSGICTHMPCNLNWKGGLLCPCHNVWFDSTGSLKETNYGVPPLPHVRVRVVGDRVLVFSS